MAPASPAVRNRIPYSFICNCSYCVFLFRPIMKCAINANCSAHDVGIGTDISGLIAEECGEEINLDIRIKQADRSHFPTLRSIELASFETLRAAGAVSGEPAASTDEELQQYLDAALLFAAFDVHDVPVGYAGGYVAEGWLHIGEVDVHPDWQRKGIGRRLVQNLLAAGRTRELVGSTLTTDRFAPFNAPFYTSLGFNMVEGDQCPARLQAILVSEETKGLDPLRRIAMMLPF